MKKVILIDGLNLLFRMFYDIPNSIKNSKGEEIKGLIGFLGSIKKIIDELNPYSVVVIFDSETSRRNNALLAEEYKCNRPDYSNVVDNPFSQLFAIKKALNFLEMLNLEV